MKFPTVFVLILAACSARDMGNTLIPDEFTLGKGSSTMNTIGGYQDHQPLFEYEGEGESSYAALTWHLPSLDGPMSREDRQRLRSESILIDDLVAVEEEEPVDIMASGGTLRADWRHAAAFGGIMLLLLIILLVKLRRSNGWH